MKVQVEHPDHEATFAMKVGKSLSFIKKIKPMNGAKVELWGRLTGSCRPSTPTQTRKNKPQNGPRFT